MASAEENRTLAGETAEALLGAIKKQSDQWSTPEQLRDMAQAYATVVEHMPKPKGRITSM